MTFCQRKQSSWTVSYILAQVAVLMILISSSSAQHRCPSSDWKLFQDRCYYFSTESRTWEDAKKYCISVGGNLASIPSQAASEFIKGEIENSDATSTSFWIGFRSIDDSGNNYKWADNTSVTYENWAENEPNDVGEECAELLSDNSNENFGKWNDLSCDDLRYSLCSADQDNGIEVECLSSNIVVSVLPSFFEAENVQLNSLHLRDYTCGGVSVTSESGTLWVFNISTFSSCSTEIKKNATHFTFCNTLSNIASNSLYTGVPSTTTFSCIYERKLDDLSLFSYSVITNVANITAPDVIGEFEAEMNLYTNDGYSIIQEDKSFEATDFLYIKIQVDTDAPDMNLVIDKCWVTPTPGTDDSLEYTFIENGCPVPNVVGEVEITQSGNGNSASFSSQVFAFVDYETVFLHCSLELCMSSPGESCIPSCLNPAALARKRRSVGKLLTTLTRRKRKAEEQSDATEDKPIVSLGPYIVVREPVDDVNTDSHLLQLSDTALVAILCSVVVGFLILIAFLVLWFRIKNRRIFQGKLDTAGFANPAMVTG